MVRYAVRAAYQRRNDHANGLDVHLFRPLLRGRGHRSAMSLPWMPKYVMTGPECFQTDK
jgi:hypothetical protein